MFPVLKVEAKKFVYEKIYVEICLGNITAAELDEVLKASQDYHNNKNNLDKEIIKLKNEVIKVS